MDRDNPFAFGLGGVLLRRRGTVRYYCGDTGNVPLEHLSDEVAVEAMDRWMKAGLEGRQSVWVEK
ncbi:MAG: hypothetical protein Kow0060_15570 [Methylohalobius crimeensis]